MTQRPAGQLQTDFDVLAQLEALLRHGADGISQAHPEDENEERLRKLEELTASCVEPEPQYRMEDRLEDRAHIDALRARTRSERRDDHAVVALKRRTALIVVSAGLFVTMGMPAVASFMVEAPESAPSAVSSPAGLPTPSTPAPKSSPTPTVTAAPGTLVRGTTPDGSPVVVVIPADAPSGLLDLLLQVVSGVVITVVTVVTTVLLTPLTRRLQHRSVREVDLRD